MADGYQSHYDADRDTWVLQVPIAITSQALARAARFIERVNHDRWLSSTGEKRAYIGRALAALRAGRIEQVVVGRGDIAVFQSTERMHPERSISIGTGGI